MIIRCLGAAIIAFVISNTVAAQFDLQFQQLPKEVRDHIREVQKSCKEANSDASYSEMQGITVLSLKGDQARDLVVDDENICGSRMAGINCSNRACGVAIYKELSRGQWKKIFDEQLYEKFLAIDWDRMRLQLMIVSIFAGDPRCQPNPNKDYTSGMSCNLIVTYRNDNWSWQQIQ